jgi:hypothetical protein
MTPAIAKAIYVLLAVGWYAIRYPYARRARRTPVIRSARGAREIALLLISLTGLGILPFLYVATGFPQFANYLFRPMQAWLGLLLLPLPCSWSPIARLAAIGRSASMCAGITG